MRAPRNNVNERAKHRFCPDVRSLPERSHAVPASRCAVTVPPQSHWARATPPGPLSRRHALARRRSGSERLSVRSAAQHAAIAPSAQDVRRARDVTPGIDRDRSRRLVAEDRRLGPPLHCPARACQKTPTCSAQLVWALRLSLRCVPGSVRFEIGLLGRAFTFGAG
jgi:hypothetical protein